MHKAVVSIREIKDGNKVLKPNFHMNFGKKRIANLKRKGIELRNLGGLTESIYTGGIFKRIFVENPDLGIPYISAQHMKENHPLDTSKLVSRKYTPRQNDMTLRKGQILVSCAGTVGNVRLINNDLDGIIGSQDIIRVIPDNTKALMGYIYAYLSTTTAYNYIQSFIYGSVVPRIEPNTLYKLPVPQLPNISPKEIHNYIIKSSELRMQANENLNSAHENFRKYLIELDNSNNHNFRSLNIKHIKPHMRLGGFFYLSEGNRIESFITKRKHFVISDFVENIFTSGRGKRIYTTNNFGIPFLSNSDLSSINPFSSCNYISSKSMKYNYLIKENMLLLGRVGQDTVGKVYIPYPKIIDCAASDNIIRLVFPDSEEMYYCFAFLSSDYGKALIKKRETGVGQPFITEDMLYDIPVPNLDEIQKKSIIENIKIYIDSLNSALEYEMKAIQIIENEIESWQN